MAGLNRFWIRSLALAATWLLSACGGVDPGTVEPVLMVSTLSGQAGLGGATDGTGAAARFAAPLGITSDTSGNLYVADSSGHTIRKVTPQGVTTTLAGTSGTSGIVNGPGSAALFGYPTGIVADKAGTLYVVDRRNRAIRKISAAGVVSTLAGGPDVDHTADGVGAAAGFGDPYGIAIDAFGNLYVTDQSVVRKVAQDGRVTTLAGSRSSLGSTDGPSALASFGALGGIAADPTGNLYIADFSNHTIRKISSAGVVTTLAGRAGVAGGTDGAAESASFSSPLSVAVDAGGNLFVADYGGATIRKITPAGSVSTLAGKAGARGHADGAAHDARFVSPGFLVVDPKGTLYVTDLGANNVRKLAPGYVVKGTLSGLQGDLVLTNNNADGTTFKANGSFEFKMPVAEGGAYAVAVKAQPAGQTCTVTDGAGTATNQGTDVKVNCVASGGSTVTYTLGGTVQGLGGAGLRLVNDVNGDTLVLDAGATGFTFDASVPAGNAYAVSVAASPAGQICTVAGGSGTAGAKVSDVAVSCANKSYALGGKLNGLSSGSQLTLELTLDDSTSSLVLAANGGFTLNPAAPHGSRFAVAVKTQPQGQTCTATGLAGPASGTVLGAVEVSVSCVAAPAVTYSVGGTVSGLSGGTLVLRNNGGDDKTLTADGGFTFATPVAQGAAYAVTVASQPAGMTCSIGQGSGVASATVTSVSVTCAATPPVTYTIGGSVSGMTGGTLVLRNNGGDDKTLTADGSFTFATPVALGAAYAVSVASQPAGQTCTVGNGSGTSSGNVSSVTVSCAPTPPSLVTIGGTVNGLTSVGLVLQNNGGDDLAVFPLFPSGGPVSFNFTTWVAPGSAYNVTVLAQPSGPTTQTCTVSAGTGSGIASGNVTTIVIDCQ